MGKVYGYIRVSSHEQNEARQLLAMRAQGIASDRSAWPMPKFFSEACGLWKAGIISACEAAKHCGMPRASFRRQAQKFSCIS